MKESRIRAIASIALLEFLFLLVSILYYHSIVFQFFSKSPPAIGYFKTYFFGVPENYYSIWGMIDFIFHLSFNKAFSLQRIFSMIILLNSSYLLVRLFPKEIINYHGQSILNRALEVLLALLLSFNPIFMFLYPMFGLSYFAFTNLALYFSFWAFINFDRRWYAIMSMLAASFFLFYAAVTYPLEIAFYILLYISIGFPIAIFLKKKAKYMITLVSVFFIYAMGFNNFAGLFSAVSTSNWASPIHVINLIYYTIGLYNPSVYGPLYSITGLNSLMFTPLLRLLSILIIILFAVLATYIGRGSKLTIYLAIMFALVEIVNFNVRGKSIVSKLIAYTISAHIIRFNHFGLLLTIFDGNRAVLILYWYIFVAIIATVLSSFRGKKDEQFEKSEFNIQKIPVRKISILGIIIAMLVILMSIGSPPIATIEGGYGNPSTYYVSNVNTPNYNQYLFSDNTNYFTSPYIFYFPNAMEPLGNDYPFEEELMNLENSPYLSEIDRSFPASSILMLQPPYVPDGNILTQIGPYYVMKNYASSNVIAGTPVFTVGSLGTFSSFVEAANQYYLSNDSYNVSISPVLNGIKYMPIPASLLNNLNSTIFLSIKFHLYIQGNESIYDHGGIVIGIASNSSDPYGYGTGNNANVVMLSYGNVAVSNLFSSYSGLRENATGWEFYNAWTNSNTWNNQPGFIYLSRNLSLNFTMLETKIGSTYYVFTNIFGRWFDEAVPQMFVNEYLTLDEYNCRTSNLNISAEINDISIGEHTSSFIPILYDSPFPSTESFINAIRASPIIVFGNGYNYQDLILSLMAINSPSSAVLPSAYAIDYPQNGWFQVFSGNDPQGAYYSENVIPYELPIQIGYGQGVGFAESVKNNSNLTVPLPSQAGSNGIVGINMLYSPMGGGIRINIGTEEYNLSTFSGNGSYFKWIVLHAPEGSKNIKFQNLNGVQSINMILETSLNIYEEAQTEIQKLTNGKLIIELGHSSQEIGSGMENTTVRGNFDLNAEQNVIFVSGLKSPSLALLLPTGYPMVYTPNISISNGSVTYLPFWGSFAGLIINNITRGETLIQVVNQSYYTGAYVYWPIIAIGIIYLYKGRKMK